MKKNVLFLFCLGSLAHAQTITNVADINPGIEGCNVTQAVVFQEKLVFTGNNGSTGSELYVYDPLTGLEEFDINPGAAYSIPFWLAEYDNKLFFQATRDDVGSEIFYYDGTDVQLLEDFNPGTASFSPEFFTVFNDKLYFRGEMPSTGGELYVYDGTSISLVFDFEPGAGPGYPHSFEITDNYLYLRAHTTAYGDDLWRTDGTTTTCLDLNPGYADAMPWEFFGSGEQLFCQAVTATSGTLAGAELVLINDTDVEVIDIDPTSESYPQKFIQYQDKVYFIANTADFGVELWCSDGTATGTIRLTDFIPGPTSSFGMASFMIDAQRVFNDVLYFVASHPSYGSELFKYDGSTVSLAYDADPVLDGDPSQLFPFDDVLYFSAFTSTNGFELRAYNGASHGLVGDINSDPLDASSSPEKLNRIGDDLYFFAVNDTLGKELFRLENAYLSTTSKSEKEAFKVWVNQEGIHINYPSSFETGVYRIYTMNGQLLTQNVTNSFDQTLPFPTGRTGIYIIELIDNQSGKKWTQKLPMN